MGDLFTDCHKPKLRGGSFIMNKRQRRKLSDSLECIHLKSVDDGFIGHYECELKLKCGCNDERCKGYEFSRKELKRVLQNRSANRRYLKKLLKQNGHTIKSCEFKYYGI
jgi:ribosomal protein L9